MGGLISAADLRAAPSLREMFADQARQRNRTKPKLAHKAKLTYQHPGLGDDNDEDPHAAFHLDAVKDIAAALERAWPVHGKLARLTAMGGVCMIEIPPLIVQPGVGIVNLVREPKHRWGSVAVRIVGELFERLRISRERFQPADVMRAIKVRSQRDIRLGTIPE